MTLNEIAVMSTYEFDFNYAGLIQCQLEHFYQAVDISLVNVQYTDIIL